MRDINRRDARWEMRLETKNEGGGMRDERLEMRDKGRGMWDER